MLRKAGLEIDRRGVGGAQWTLWWAFRMALGAGPIDPPASAPVLTHWEDEESFQAWRNGPAIEAHAGERGRPIGEGGAGHGHGQGPVSTGASLLEFEVVLDVAGNKA